MDSVPRLRKNERTHKLMVVQHRRETWSRSRKIQAQEGSGSMLEQYSNNNGLASWHKIRKGGGFMTKQVQTNTMKIKTGKIDFTVVNRHPKSTKKSDIEKVLFQVFKKYV